MAKAIELNGTYKHNGNGRIYTVLNTEVFIQETGEWIPAVLYEARYARGPFYVRSQREFTEKFHYHFINPNDPVPVERVVD